MNLSQARGAFVARLPDRLRKRIRATRPMLEQLGLISPASFGLDGLDRKLLKHVNFRSGVFVEAGANDGMSQSNTVYFERYLGWRGLLVEPMPELAAKCRANRPGAIVEQCALVASGDTRSTVDMTYCNLMSLVDGALGSSHADLTHIQRGRKFLAAGDEVRPVSVPTARLGAILQRHGLDHVDLLSLDVEGFEAQALLGLEFDKVAPTWILVEANHPKAVEAALGGRYGLVAELTHHDRLYRLKT
jgi:FkbM family methyltransferase